MIKNWKSFNESVVNEICICKIAPMGSDGLEGFMENEEYKYEFLKIKDKGYYRVYHDENYYETCGPKIFNRYFKIKQKNAGIV